ncbi:HNH endonuclease [Variovorax sp. V118]
MRYWWVNHNQTFKAESTGGFIWAPLLTSNDRRKVTWDNLKLVSKGDMVFSYAHQHICAVGLATAAPKPSGRPQFEAPGAQNWNIEGTYVSIAWAPLETRFSPSKAIAQIRTLLPTSNSPIRAEDGHGNQSCYLASISKEFATKLLQLIERTDPSAGSLLIDAVEGRAEDKAEEEIRRAPLSETTKRQLVLARLGHGQFRTDVLKRGHFTCRVTGVTGAGLLTASHIKPWRVADNDERLDPHNGLLLSPHVDRLFDRGLVSFAADGSVMLANEAASIAWRAWGLDDDLRISAMSKREALFMEYHRDQLFKR